MPEDAELLRSYADQRSESAFAELVKRHLNLVYSAALRRASGNTHRAAEITQEVFIALARHAGPLSRHPVLTGWLYTCTRNAALDATRAENRRRIREQEAFLMQQLNLPAASTGDWERLRPVLDAAMDQLNGRDREAVLLRYFEGRSYREVGARLAVAEDAARMRVERALEKLRGLLSRRGVSSSAAALAAVLSQQTVSAAPAGLATSVTGASLASGCAPAALSLMQFMTSTKITLGVVGFAAALAVGAATQEIFTESRAQRELSAVNQANKIATDRLGALEARVQAAARAQNRNQKNPSATTAAPAGSAAGSGTAVTPMNEAELRLLGAAARTRALEEAHPEVERAFKDFMKANVASRYADFFRSLGLSPDQEDQFENLMMTAHIGLNIEGQQFTFTWDSSNASPPGSAEPGLRTLLGDSGFQQLQEYDRTEVARTLTSNLAGASAAASSPMTAAQTQQIAEILAENSPSYRQGKKMQAQSLDWEGALTQAQEILSSDQLTAFGAIHQQVLFNLALAAAGKTPAAAAGN